MKSFTLISFVLFSSLLTGCAGNYYGFPGRSYGNESLDIHELLRYQADFANKSAASRTEECRWLLKRQQETPQVGWALRLMIGRVLSDSCGDPAKLVHTYETLADRNMPEQRVAWMASYQAEVLKRIGNLSRKAAVAERKQPTQKSGKDESKLLREKLEAIRSIEKKMDENISDENQR